jgi:hypothetical protein
MVAVVAVEVQLDPVVQDKMAVMVGQALHF